MVQDSGLRDAVQGFDFDLGPVVAGSQGRTAMPRLHRGQRWYGVRWAGRVFEIQTSLDSKGKPSIADRGEVGGFSRKSRARLCKLTASIPWELFATRFFVTLTYPEVFPRDGRIVKGHFAAWRRRLERRYGKQAVVWKLEFQRRGAAHFHCLLSVPEGTAIDEFRLWLSDAWYGIVGSGDLKHLAAGTQVQVAETDCGRYFAYGVKSTGSKEYQNQVPEGFENVGRFWGAWNVRPEWRGVLISDSDFVDLRRRMCAWSKSRGGYVPRRSRLQGAWMLTEGRSAALVLAQLGRGLPTVERMGL